jgi:arsenical pump membrane protein
MVGMHPHIAAEVLAAAALIAVLAWAVRRPRGWPEAVAAVPAAALLVAVGAVSGQAALTEAQRLGPVVGFLGCVLVLSKLCDDDGLFRFLGGWLARGGSASESDQGGSESGYGESADDESADDETADDETADDESAGGETADAGSAGGGQADDRSAGGERAGGGRGNPARRLLAQVFVVASVTTAVLSLDATVVLLTPVVLIAAGRLGVRAKPHAYACGHLANSASLLLPVSNLTNLLAFAVSGLSFAKFAELMALPWLVAIGVEYVGISRFFAADLTGSGAAPMAAPRQGDAPRQRDAVGSGVEPRSVPHPSGDATGKAARSRPTGGGDIPVFTLCVVAATLAGFVVASAAGVNPAWAALAGALALAVRALMRGETSVAAIAASADVPFLLFVLALGIVVTAVVDNGLGSALRPLVPAGSSLPALLAITALAAVLAAVLNNLPAVLVLLPLAAVSGPGAVLAVLLGVNIGPNLTYTGSLATLLWRRVLRDHGTDAELGEFTRLGVLTVLPGLAMSVIALWFALRVMGA